MRKEINPTFKMYFKATVDGDINFHDKTDKWDGYLFCFIFHNLFLLFENCNNFRDGYLFRYDGFDFSNGYTYIGFGFYALLFGIFE